MVGRKYTSLEVSVTGIQGIRKGPPLAKEGHRYCSLRSRRLVLFGLVSVRLVVM
jgi:hypothetical protein